MAADECNIRVVARFRPLNESEERTGSKSVVKFPPDQEGTLLISVRICFTQRTSTSSFIYCREKFTSSIKYFVQIPLKKKFTMKPLKKLSKTFSVVTMERSLPMDKHQVEKLIQWR